MVRFAAHEVYVLCLPSCSIAAQSEIQLSFNGGALDLDLEGLKKQLNLLKSQWYGKD